MKKYVNYESIVEAGLITPEILADRPACVKIMQPELVEYIPGKKVTFAFPVLEIFLNPRRSMQGGFIAAAFDNAFGALVFLAAKSGNTATIDLTVNYHRPIFENDELRISATIKSLGKTIVNLAGEGFNKEKKLVATAYTNIMLLDPVK